MRRLFIVLLMLTAAPAWAEWVKYAENEEATFYLDSIKRDGDLSRFLQLHDYKVRHKHGYFSMQFLSEYDCKEERRRVLSWAVFSEKMADGKQLHSKDAPGEWVHIVAGTFAAKAMQIVCPLKRPDESPTQGG